MEIVLDKIRHLISLGETIVLGDKQQPHSTIYTMSCGCKVNSEININYNTARQEAYCRQWIIACSKHKDLETHNKSFVLLYQTEQELLSKTKKKSDSI